MKKAKQKTTAIVFAIVLPQLMAIAIFQLQNFGQNKIPNRLKTAEPQMQLLQGRIPKPILMYFS